MRLLMQTLVDTVIEQIMNTSHRSVNCVYRLLRVSGNQFGRGAGTIVSFQQITIPLIQLLLTLLQCGAAGTQLFSSGIRCIAHNLMKFDSKQSRRPESLFAEL